MGVSPRTIRFVIHPGADAHRLAFGCGFAALGGWGGGTRKIAIPPKGTLAILLFVASACCSFLHAEEKSRATVDEEFHRQLGSLATKCDELGLKQPARLTRKWILQRDPHRQYLFVPGHAAKPDSDAVPNDELTLKWQAKFVELRREHANQLFELARKEAHEGSAVVSYQLLHEVLRNDPSHPQARRIVGLGPEDEVRPKARSPRIVHAKFGWQRGRWWQIESPHFQITTDHSSDTGIAMAQKLEEFHTVWRQLFYEYWNTAESLRARFENDPFRNPPEPKHHVVLFRDRDEYVQRLQEAEPQIKLTLGYYLKGNRTSYFYHGDESLLPVWYHEATHQLFQEIGNAISNVGEKWNFWLIEGVAVYMESTTDLGPCFTVGGFDSDRLQFLRSRVLSGEPQMPIAELARLGREDLQRHPEIRRLYTYAAGLVHFLMDADAGRSREKFIRLLLAVYFGRDSAESWLDVDALSSPKFDEAWREFLIVRDDDLRYLGPPPRRRNLSLVKGEISDQALGALSTSERLEWLDLSLTQISSVGLRACGPLKNLKRLSLVGTKIDDAVAPVLAEMSQLEELDLSGNAITDHCLAALSKLSELKVLRLAHTPITDAGIQQLSTLKKLEELDLENTKVTNQAVQEIKRHLPNLK